MAHKIEALRGMDDVLPGEVEKWQWVEEKARIFFQTRGFKEIRTPLLEYTELFSRSVGESSDIVHKEMFSFEDRGGRNVTLRPEMTASVARAAIEHGLLSQAKSLRLYYLGPMFRAERPQAGRKRQFHQAGIEIINESGWTADWESISLLHDFLRYAGVKNFQLKINDLGTAESQKKTAQELQRYFSDQKSKLCKDCHYRLEKNVLRIFDCKNEPCQPVIDKAPWEKIAPLGADFEKVAGMLKSQSIPFQIQRRLVRGLDYYNGLVFEASAEGLGAQDALAGGGRYDRLYSDLGGKPTPCTGFSIGVERLMAALERSEPPLTEKIRENFVYFAPLRDPDAARNGAIMNAVQEAACKLREQGIRVFMAPMRFTEPLGISDHLKVANKMGAKYVVIAGADEISKKKWTVKKMDQKEQEEVKMGELFFYLKGDESV